MDDIVARIPLTKYKTTRIELIVYKVGDQLRYSINAIFDIEHAKKIDENDTLYEYDYTHIFQKAIFQKNKE